MMYRFLRFWEGKPKAVTLSYDDGSRADLRMAKILDEYNMKCTFNLTNTCLESKSGVTREEVLSYILENGHEVALHTANHRANGKLRPVAGIQEVLECRKELERSFGRIIRGMAYPDSGIRHWENGARYNNVRHYLQCLDIAYARTLGEDNDLFQLPVDWYAWMPTVHHINPQIFEFIEKFILLEPNEGYVANRYPRLFYLWGHSYEFDKDNNWEQLIEICELLGNKEDTWYATNIEIYEYIKAYESLIFSADETLVYNPTLFKVWFYQNDTVYCVEPGETKRL